MRSLPLGKAPRTHNGTCTARRDSRPPHTRATGSCRRTHVGLAPTPRVGTHHTHARTHTRSGHPSPAASYQQRRGVVPLALQAGHSAQRPTVTQSATSSAASRPCVLPRPPVHHIGQQSWHVQLQRSFHAQCTPGRRSFCCRVARTAARTRTTRSLPSEIPQDARRRARGGGVRHKPLKAHGTFFE